LPGLFFLGVNNWFAEPARGVIVELASNTGTKPQSVSQVKTAPKQMLLNARELESAAGHNDGQK
jgi:hypothetical protein